MSELFNVLSPIKLVINVNYTTLSEMCIKTGIVSNNQYCYRWDSNDKHKSFIAHCEFCFNVFC